MMTFDEQHGKGFRQLCLVMTRGVYCALIKVSTNLCVLIIRFGSMADQLSIVVKIGSGGKWCY